MVVKCQDDWEDLYLLGHEIVFILRIFGVDKIYIDAQTCRVLWLIFYAFVQVLHVSNCIVTQTFVIKQRHTGAANWKKKISKIRLLLLRLLSHVLMYLENCRCLEMEMYEAPHVCPTAYDLENYLFMCSSL
ncbi:hypothetical protein CHUAL_011402 [Chamberlinius hualienensis]